jgi:hypothetical protein
LNNVQWVGELPLSLSCMPNTPQVLLRQYVDVCVGYNNFGDPHLEACVEDDTASNNGRQFTGSVARCAGYPANVTSLDGGGRYRLTFTAPALLMTCALTSTRPSARQVPRYGSEFAKRVWCRCRHQQHKNVLLGMGKPSRPLASCGSGAAALLSAPS